MSEVKRVEVIAGLRALADYLEKHREIQVDWQQTMDFLLIAPNADAVRDAFPGGDATVNVDVWAGNEHTVAEKWFGAVRLRVASVKFAEVSAA